MTVHTLATRRIEKVWGRHLLGLGFEPAPDSSEPVGEIWFESSGSAPDALLIKYLFTSEKLSVQVHPSDEEARARGHRSGKEECWLILDAEPDARLGVGLRERVDAQTLRAAACDGSIEGMLDWKSIKPGDLFYLPAGTIHAIGAGITLIEIQQNIDLTYRLYDYGRPRELHLEDGMAVARPEPWQAPNAVRSLDGGRLILAEGRKFVLERFEGLHSGMLSPAADRPAWIAPLAGSGEAGGEVLNPGGVWIADSTISFEFDGDCLIAYPGAEVAPDLLA